MRINSDRVRLFAGNLPRPFAIQAMMTPLEGVLQQAKQRGYIDLKEKCESDEDHFDSYYSIANGNPFEKNQKRDPCIEDKLRRVFNGKLLRNKSMAYKFVEKLKDAS